MFIKDIKDAQNPETYLENSIVFKAYYNAIQDIEETKTILEEIYSPEAEASIREMEYMEGAEAAENFRLQRHMIKQIAKINLASLESAKNLLKKEIKIRSN